MSSEVTAADDIWDDDLLDRKQEALLLISFLTRIFETGRHRGSRAYSVAVDGGYGVGKTFFLKRLAAHLALDHRVAFIDAWSDDLQDDPLTALTATLHEAFSALIPQDEDARRNWDEVLAKSGRIASIVGRGLLRRGVGFLITQSAAEAAEAALNSVNMDIGDLRQALTDDPKEILNEKPESARHASERMKTRIQEFHEAKKAIDDLKIALSALVKQLPDSGMKLPVFIIIDEIDRCKPTYAIKLFEEIKHVFDVEGIVFILGMHQSELSHSVAGAYGPGFNGWKYLRRFINKTYNLRTPSLAPLIASLVRDMNLDVGRLRYPQIVYGDQNPTNADVSLVIARYMGDYDLRARDAYSVIETLQTCLLLTGDKPLLLGYLLPLILSKTAKEYNGAVIYPSNWTIPWSLYVGGSEVISVDAYAKKVASFAASSPDDLLHRVNASPLEHVAHEVFRLVMNNAFAKDPLGHPNMYPELLENVARFD